MAKQKIRKAIVPVAGFGTRFLPATKAMPKEMLPIVDKPIIQYIVEEAVAAGLDEVIFVTGRNKRALEDHFDANYELECLLRDKGKTDALREVREISDLVRVVYVRQKEALGLGHAILQAEQVVGDEPFAVLLGDDVIDAEKPVIGQLLEAYSAEGRSVVAVRRCAEEQIGNYGVVDPEPVGGSSAGTATPRLHRVTGIVEKPKPADAPSDLAVTGRYLLSPRVFRYLRETEPGKGGEIQLTDALQRLAAEGTDEPGQGLLAYEYEGRYYDGGSKLELIKATVDFALARPEFRADLLDFLKQKTTKGV